MENGMLLCLRRGMRRIFRDLKLLSGLMTAWLLVVILIMVEIGVFQNQTFVAWGPRPTLTFLHVPIDTMYKYSILLCMIMVHTFVSDFISDGLVPHVINQLQDVRCRRLPHRHSIYYVVTTVWSLYSAVNHLFLIFLALGQLDLLLARLCSDLLANMVTTSLYLEHKEYDAAMAHQLLSTSEDEEHTNSSMERTDEEELVETRMLPSASGTTNAA
jgi:hypothetical protein